MCTKDDKLKEFACNINPYMCLWTIDATNGYANCFGHDWVKDYCQTM